MNQQDYRYPLLDRVESFLQTEVAPQAHAIDQNFQDLKQAWQGLGELKALTLRVPVDFQGAGLNPLQFASFQIAIARYSGALAFLQTQHQSAGSMLANSENTLLQQEFLPLMAKGKIGMGVGFSQLRRLGAPLMKAQVTATGYILDGTVPWITGYGFFEYFTVGALLPTGEAVYGVVPFRDSGTENGEISFSQPLELLAMNSTQTVTAQVKQWHLRGDRVVMVTPPDAIHQRDRANVLKHSFFPLGCARAGLDLLKAQYARKALSSIQKACQSLQRELNDCQEAIFQALQQTPNSRFFEHHLQLRAWAINLAQRCAQGAAIAASGKANLKSNPQERIYREALMFSVFGQTEAVLEASLAQLLRL
ncbi:MAG: acyl-CoA dehydrogenase family protein [Jaaginema sp. PMC 1079.18]|nr:acyl-CoA dehydrogenase family protein [Jaaginema sp. PMC 1080.18]MEC4853524.1 acyl-CoA dehydrogenase family protein [Jaaginema sp. PMC 1079.18]MEC4868556.1 acyl-CoA dehydrogenase family protein [Jaaginema sp. PMC 1078.18]